MPLDALRAVAAADRLGRLPHLIERWFRRREREDQPFTQFIGIYQGYPVVLAACVVIVCMAALPKFHGILHDFKIHLPWSARLMEALAPAQASGAAVAIILIFLVLAPIGRGLSRVFPSAQTVLPFGGAVRDQVLWWIPFVHRYVRDRGMADMCDLLAAGIEAGRPLNECLRDCADGQGNAVLRYRLHAWADAVENGRNIHEAARYARLPSLFVRFLATARSDEDLGQVLKFLWRHYEFNFARTRAMLRAMYVPIVVLAMGILVAIVGLSLFQPLCLFINDLARQIEGGF
jgi:type II secretory pathway component PulF